MKRCLFLVLAVASCLSFAFEEDFATMIQQKADAYFSKMNRAKLALVFNQPIYSPGDTARFNALYLRASDLKPVVGKQLVHVCLFDQNGKKKLTRWFSIANGTGAYEFAIPESIGTGNYVLVAFTDWMKNWDQSLFFKQEFSIAGKSKLMRSVFRDSVECYVEGGQLVAGVENKVAFRYSGNKTKVRATLKESEKDLSTLSLASDSITTITFIPSANSVYYVELSGKKFVLPSVKSSGVAVQLKPSSDRLKVQLTNSKGTESNDLHFLVFNNSGLIFQSRIEFGPEQRQDITLPQTLPFGIVQLVVTDSKYKKLSSRVAYIPGNQALSSDFSNVSSIYTTRKPVAVDVRIKNSDGFGLQGTFAARVLNEKLFQFGKLGLDYLTFGSDLSSDRELNIKQTSLTEINDYLITQICPWFNWEMIVSQLEAISFKPQEYLMFSGRASYAKSGLPVRDSTMIMFYLEKNLSGYETYAHGKGRFSFPLVLNASNSDRFFYTASFRGDDVEEIVIKTDDPDSLISFRAQPTETMDEDNPYFFYRSQKNAINNSYAFFSNPKALNDTTFDPNKAVEDELQGADATVRLSDFLQMPNMEEVLKEIVRSVEYRKINGRHVVRVYTTMKKPNNHTGPLYVIDGQFTKNPEFLINLKPSEINTLKLVKDSRKLFALGRLGANGVIIVNTKKHVKIQERSMLDFSGLLPIDHLNKITSKPNIPDFRSCMLWLPSARLNATGSTQLQFTTSDDTGKYVIQIQGITDGGTPFYAEYPFEVKYGGN